MAQACGRRRRGRGDKLVGEVCDAVDSARKHCLPLPTLPTLPTCPPAQPLRRARYAGCGLVTGQPAPTSGLALMTLTARFSDALTAGGPRIRPCGDALVHVQQQENSSFGRERRRRCPTRRRGRCNLRECRQPVRMPDDARCR